MNWFILDISPQAATMRLWLAGEDGQRCYHELPCSCSLQLAGAEADKWGRWLSRRLPGLRCHWQQGRTIQGQKKRVLAIQKASPAQFQQLQRWLRPRLAQPGLEVFGLERTPLQQFVDTSGLFPGARVTLTDHGIKLADKRQALAYAVPNWRLMQFKWEAPGNPCHYRQLPELTALCPDGSELQLEGRQLPETLSQLLQQQDPDVLVAPYGDRLLLPLLQQAGVRHLHRRQKTALRPQGRRRSLVSYGQVIAKQPAWHLDGRLHIDPTVSFFYNEVGLEGLWELARLSGLGVQTICRSAPGTVITAMEVSRAVAEGKLVPSVKQQPEQVKTAAELAQVDQGGLTYQPRPGLYTQVAELDFFSLYPCCMVNYNLSGETLFCHHEDCTTILPGTGFRICTRQQGLVAATVGAILRRRQQLKAQMRQGPDQALYQRLYQRQNALKWLLVVSFGFLGFRNAVFGGIEAHEATTALGRQLLLEAKTIAEDSGYTFIHGLTDALYLYHPQARHQDYQRLLHRINHHLNHKFPGCNPQQRLGFRLELEAMYSWLWFPSAQGSAQAGLPQTYVGRTAAGSLKIRGLMCRRRDTPLYIKRFQQASLKQLQQAATAQEFHQATAKLHDLYHSWQQHLAAGQVPGEQLALQRRLGKQPQQYQRRCDQAEAAGTLATEGIELQAGQCLRLVYVDDPRTRALPLETWQQQPLPLDMSRYSRMLQKALKELLPPEPGSKKAPPKQRSAKATDQRQMELPW